MHVMEIFMKFFYEWEIKLLVLLSFTLQMFLFFAGTLRRRNTNLFLRLSIWAAYLGADLVAVYALGYLSRHEEITSGKHIPTRAQPLAFFWAPFLLIHLGGQDTVAAFSMEDNNLWLRHLLNLVVQVVLALYVFWKSIGRHSLELLVSGIFVFVAGVIKYGERTWSLKCGSFKSLESSTGNQYKQRLPPVEVTNGDAVYADTVRNALHSMPNVLDAFSARGLLSDGSLREDVLQDPKKMLTVVGLELGMMYDDLYTKALVLRTRSGIIVRCISQISALVAFALFFTGDKQIYDRADAAITYSLFIGGFFLDLCSVFIFLMSPWTWAWLKVRECNRLASVSWFLLSSGIGWPEKKTRWPNSMGQYNLVSWLIGRDQPRSFNQRVMAVVVRLVNLVGTKKRELFWMSKLLDTEYVDANKMMERVAEGINGLHDELSKGHREWPNLGPLLKEQQDDFFGDFGSAIVLMHLFTEAHLSKYPPPDMEANAAAAPATDMRPCVMADVCRKLSNYMMYLLVSNPSMLPLNASAVATLEWLHDVVARDRISGAKGSILLYLKEELIEFDPEPGEEILEEMVDMWMRILAYAASKSRPEMHASLLSRGGELLSFVWLLMCHKGLGDSETSRILLINISGGTAVEEVYALYVPGPISSPVSSRYSN